MRQDSIGGEATGGALLAIAHTRHERCGVGTPRQFDEFAAHVLLKRPAARPSARAAGSSRVSSGTRMVMDPAMTALCCCCRCLQAIAEARTSNAVSSDRRGASERGQSSANDPVMISPAGSYVPITTPVVETSLSTSASPDGMVPSENRRLPDPMTNGKTHRRYWSTRL
jgi:hypothetical protein